MLDFCFVYVIVALWFNKNSTGVLGERTFPNPTKETDMDKKTEEIRKKIQNLNAKLKKIEEKNETSITKLIKNTAKNGIDIRILAGMLLNAGSIIQNSHNQLEAWQQAGEKFLSRKKDKSDKLKDPSTAKATQQKG